MRRHRSGCDCALCNANDKERAFKELEKKEAKNIKDYGWYCHMVSSGDNQSPTGINYHTHGCPESFKHLDIQIVAAMPPELAHNLFCLTINKIKAGEKFKPGDRSSEILQDMDVLFIEARECGRDVLRMILPDSKGELDQEKMDRPFNTQWNDPPPRIDFTKPSLN